MFTKVQAIALLGTAGLSTTDPVAHDFVASCCLSTFQLDTESADVGFRAALRAFQNRCDSFLGTMPPDESKHTPQRMEALSTLFKLIETSEVSAGSQELLENAASSLAQVKNTFEQYRLFAAQQTVHRNLARENNTKLAALLIEHNASSHGGLSPAASLLGLPDTTSETILETVENILKHVRQATGTPKERMTYRPFATFNCTGDKFLQDVPAAVISLVACYSGTIAFST